MNSQQELISSFLNKGIIIEKAAAEFIIDNNLNFNHIIPSLDLKNRNILTKEFLENQLQEKVEVIKTKKIIAKDYEPVLEIERNYIPSQTDKTIDSFINYYRSRYEKIKELLSKRPELKNLISLGRFNESTFQQEVSVIGMIYDKFVSKAGNTIIDLDDPTGKIKVFINQNKGIGEDRLFFDEVVGFRGKMNKNYMYAENIIFPDIPIPPKINTISLPINSVFISDLHFGSKEFLSKVSNNFIDWLKKGEKEASKIKYIFIAGDIVDGVGVYPGQEEDLQIKDIYHQYSAFEEFISKLPDHIEVIIAPGNHDAMRLAEPQPAISKEYLPNLYNSDNIHLVSNPAQIRIHGSDNESVSILMYHGYSFNRLIYESPFLRSKKAMIHPEHIMKEVLMKRHLAPTHGSSLISPEEEDYLYIDKVPDIFHTGDLHSFGVDKYRETTLINSSTFQSQTAFMDKVGHVANPGKVTIVNLQNREITIKDLMNP